MFLYLFRGSVNVACTGYISLLVICCLLVLLLGYFDFDFDFNFILCNIRLVTL